MVNIILKQAEGNLTGLLYDAGTIFPGQYVGLTSDIKLVIGDHLEEVVRRVRGEKVNEVPLF